MRKALRVDLITRLNYQSNRSSFNEGFTQNISEVGGCFLLSGDLDPGQIIKLNFNLPTNGTTIKNLQAQVIWQKDFLTGVKFVV